MQKYSTFYNYCLFVLINIFLVIIAGSVVRSTQSGMGCPDWPKCFGQYIPPTSMQQVIFNSNKKYNKGQFIIHNDSLKYAKEKFISGSNYYETNWNNYTKHNNATFEVYKTWIEYINRLLGALLGLIVFIQLIWAFVLRKYNKSILWLSFALVLLTGFQAFLGKTVVDSNLEGVKISIHLAGAVAMLLLEVLILHKIKTIAIPQSSNVNKYINVLSILVVIQFFMGVLVRQQIDKVSELHVFMNRNSWLNEVGLIYYIHRSFSILLLLGFFFLYFKFKNELHKKIYLYILGVLLAQLIVGVIFNYANFPAFAQPIHLLLSCLLIVSLFIFLLRKNNNTLL